MDRNVDPARLTVGELWSWLAADTPDERLLAWAPDVAALTKALLERSQSFRFVVSPPPGCSWPPPDLQPFSENVASLAAEWCASLDQSEAQVPEQVRSLWATIVDHLDTPVEEMRQGRAWQLCEAVLALHAVADEASAGLGGAGTAGSAGALHRARAQELLARTGSLSRLPVDRVVHVPKTRTTSVGMTHRSLARYTSTTTGAIPATWHRAPVQRLRTERRAQQANVLLLPWPLRIRETDFEPVPGSVRRREREPFGFFSYHPSEAMDLSLLDRVLAAARDEVSSVDAVVLPEACLHESQVDGFEAVLAEHGVTLLVSGIRVDPEERGRLPRNAVHLGVRLGETWWHYRQHKHHRWFLDAGQIEQYNIAGALHPDVRWWEDMEVPPRSVNIFELGGGVTVAAVVCEDLARQDGVAEMLRSVGPTLVITLLLDGPQLSSRWTSRYAGVLADDPGSAVLTLTASGMANRSRPRGLPPSPVVAMWKDPTRGVREVALEPGAHGVLLKAVLGRTPRYAADGRAPVDDVTDLYVTGVHSVKAPPASEPEDGAVSRWTAAVEHVQRPPLETIEMSILCSWVEGAAQSLVDPAATGTDRSAPAVVSPRARLEGALDAAAAGAPWRAELGLPEPSAALAEALSCLDEMCRKTGDALAEPTPESLLAALGEMEDADRTAALVRRLLRTSLDRVLS